MKLKLIRSGGLTGKPVTIEEDLSDYPASVRKHLEKIFSSTGSVNEEETPPNSVRDGFQYFAQYKGKHLPLEKLEQDALLADLVRKLKERLHF